MTIPLIAWWKGDTARHSFFFANFLVGLPFTIFNTYVFYQIQTVGFLIGHDDDGLPCTGTYCIVPFGSSELDVNTAVLYLNALGYALGGALTVIITAYADYWKRKHLLITFFIVSYGALSVPAYWLKDPSTHTLASLMGVFVAFFIVTLIIIALLNVYIPHCMREMAKEDESAEDSASSVDPGVKRRKYGFSMTVFGSVNSIAGGVVMLLITIILSRTLDGVAAQSSGLLVTTIVGFITIAGATVTYAGLPILASKSVSQLTKNWSQPLVEMLSPFKDLFVRKDLGCMLISYTIYTDATFAMSTITSQLYIAEVRPSTLEYSLYSLAQNLFQIGCLLVFLTMSHFFEIKLSVWLFIGYVMILIVPVWGMIGLANVDFGFKSRWEFFVQLLLSNVSSAIVNTSFRVLFSDSIPKGSELQWVGMQIVLWSATSWVNYVASGPLQNSTHQLRFPLVLCLVFLCIPPVLDATRRYHSVFDRDRKRWAAEEKNEVEAVEDQHVTPTKLELDRM